MQYMRADAFKKNAREALADPNLRSALAGMTRGFIPRRRAAVDALPDFEGLKLRAREIKDHTLAHLDHYLETFEANCLAAGGKVLWCADAEEARNAVLEICRSANARTVT